MNSASGSAPIGESLPRPDVLKTFKSAFETMVIAINSNSDIVSDKL